MIRFTTLGSIRLDGCDGVPLTSAAQQPRRLALLAYLALARPRAQHRRDSLVALLWPELDQDRARNALRQALHAIRQSLGVNIIKSAGTESLEVDWTGMRCDVWELERASEPGDHRRVLEMYEGELLPGLFVSDAPAFEQWLDAERARMREVVRQSAWAVAEVSLLDGRGDEVSRSVRLAVSLSDFDEGSIRRAMQLLANAGERAAALSMYERSCTDMRNEFDAVPSAMTRALATSMREHQQADSRGTAPTNRPVAHVHPSTAGPTLSHGVIDSSETGHPAVTPRRQSRQFVAMGFAAVITLAATARLAPSANATLDLRRVQVGAFTNESGSPVLDTLARMLAFSARDAMLKIDNVQVVSSSRGDDPLEMFDVASTPSGLDRAGTVVRGMLRAADDSVEMYAEVIDRNTNEIRRVVVARTGWSTVLERRTSVMIYFADRLTTAVATALYPGWGNALSQPPSYTSYRLFLDGMRHIKREQHDVAAASFLQAWQSDSSFTAAGLLAASEFYQLRRFVAAESLVTVIGARSATLPPVDAHLLDWLVRSLRGDRIGARAAMNAIVSVSPAADLAWLQLAIDNIETARPREALIALDRIDKAAEFGEGWASYWATRIEALHLLREHERELAVAREGLRRYPELRVLQSYEMRALAALGRVREVNAAVRALATENGVNSGVKNGVKNGANNGFDGAMIMRQAALELSAHGYPEAARELLTRSRAWYKARPVSEQTTLWYQSGLARTHYLLDDRKVARTIYDSLLRAYPKCLDCIGVLGVLAARSGDLVAADSLNTVLSNSSRPYLFGRHIMWQARAAAARRDWSRAETLVHAAFAAGFEFDVMTHADPDLRHVRPESVYRTYARAEP